MIKEDIVRLVTIKDITDKYGIKVTNHMCKCPFGHKDNSPSMKIYDKTNTFYCFSCHKSGDLINMVQFMYGLNFQQAMEKINDDFNLHFSNKSCYNREQILKFEEEKQIKKLKEEEETKRINNLFMKACNRRIMYENLIKNYKKQLTIFNWEEITQAIAYCQNSIGKLDMYIYDLCKI